MKFSKMEFETFSGSTVIEVEIIKTIKHGFNLQSGAWGLYAPSKCGIKSEPAEFVIFRKKGCRSHNRINKKRIIKIME